MAAWISATLSILTPSSVSASDAWLPALLRVAWSALKEPGPVVWPCLTCGVEELAACDTPRSDFNPSKLLRISMNYSLELLSASSPITVVIRVISLRYSRANSRLLVPPWAGYRNGKYRIGRLGLRCGWRCRNRPLRSARAPAPRRHIRRARQPSRIHHRSRSIHHRT